MLLLGIIQYNLHNPSKLYQSNEPNFKNMTTSNEFSKPWPSNKLNQTIQLKNDKKQVVDDDKKFNE